MNNENSNIPIKEIEMNVINTKTNYIDIKTDDKLQINKDLISEQIRDDINNIKNIPVIDLENKLLINNCKLEDMGITFILPGNEINLKENGSEITLDAYNLEEYVNLIYKTLCFEGISESVKAFKTGFNLVFPLKSMRCFHSFEISELICGANADAWEEQILYDSVVPNYGYNKNRYFIFLIKD